MVVARIRDSKAKDHVLSFDAQRGLARLAPAVSVAGVTGPFRKAGTCPLSCILRILGGGGGSFSGT